ncbi:hypothetical protein EV127DRAFT_401819 [Xylaria flabelliformis]|nr:hypothetical protein EV127DRAFT_401819 [Xylaria flabelliformis]
MEKYVEYHPVDSHEDSHRSSETLENGALLGDELRVNHKRRVFKTVIKTFVAILCVTVYTAIVASATWTKAAQTYKAARRHGTRWLKSPADDFIVYEPHVMELWEDPNAPQYFGEPSEEIDRNWHNLFEHHNLGLSADYMKELGRQEEGIRLPDGTYYASMMVFHHLHCLKNLQHALHPDHYELNNLTDHQLAMHWDHTDHCLHMLMDAVMCQGDTTLITMYWQDNMFRPAGNFTSPHECINWDRLMEWTADNSRDLFADNVLVHPKKGPLISGGKPTKAFWDSINGGGFGKLGGT